MIEMLPNEHSCNGDRGGEPQSTIVGDEHSFSFLKEMQTQDLFFKKLFTYLNSAYSKNRVEAEWGMLTIFKYLKGYQVEDELMIREIVFSFSRWVMTQWSEQRFLKLTLDLILCSPPYYLCICGKGIWPTKVFILLTYKVRVTTSTSCFLVRMTWDCACRVPNQVSVSHGMCTIYITWENF